MRRPILSVGRRVRLRHTRAAVEAALRPGRSILDAGCSDGRLAADLARAHPDCRVLGIDIDDASLVIARRAAEELPNLTVERLAIGAGEPERDSDVVVCTDVLEHVRDDRPAFRWLAGRLRPGGTLVVHVPADPQAHAIPSIARALQAEVASGSGPHVRMGYRPEELLERARDSGLGDASVRWTFHHPAARLAADLDTWTFLRGARPVKLVLLPALLALAALEREPSPDRRGNGLLLVARAPA